MDVLQGELRIFFQILHTFTVELQMKKNELHYTPPVFQWSLTIWFRMKISPNEKMKSLKVRMKKKIHQKLFRKDSKWKEWHAIKCPKARFKRTHKNEQWLNWKIMRRECKNNSVVCSVSRFIFGFIDANPWLTTHLSLYIFWKWFISFALYFFLRLLIKWIEKKNNITKFNNINEPCSQ